MSVELSTEAGGSRPLAVLPSGRVLADDATRAKSRVGEQKRARERAAARAMARRKAAAAAQAEVLAMAAPAGAPAVITFPNRTAPCPRRVRSHDYYAQFPRSPQPRPAAEPRALRGRNHYLRF